MGKQNKNVPSGTSHHHLSLLWHGQARYHSTSSSLPSCAPLSTWWKTDLSCLCHVRQRPNAKGHDRQVVHLSSHSRRTLSPGNVVHPRNHKSCRTRLHHRQDTWGVAQRALSNIVWSRPERSGFSDCTRDVTFRWHYCSFGNEHGGDCVELPPELPRCTARSSFRKESWKLSSVQEFFGWWSSWIVTDSPPSKMLSYLTRCCFVELTFRGVHNIGRGCTENKQDMRAPYIYG